MKAFLFILVAYIAGCSDEMDDNRSVTANVTKAEEFGITNGIKVDESKSEFFPGSFKLVTIINKKISTCTATAIATNIALTAAHCVTYDTDSKLNVLIEVNKVYSDSKKYHNLSPTRIVLHSDLPDRSFTDDLNNELMATDIAVLIYPQNTFKKEDIVPISSDMVGMGDYVMVMGYGRTKLDQTADGKYYGFNRARFTELVRGYGHIIHQNSLNDSLAIEKGYDSGTLPGDSGSALYKVNLGTLGIDRSDSEIDIYRKLVRLGKGKLKSALSIVGVGSAYISYKKDKNHSNNLGYQYYAALSSKETINFLRSFGTCKIKVAGSMAYEGVLESNAACNKLVSEGIVSWKMRFDKGCRFNNKPLDRPIIKSACSRENLSHSWTPRMLGSF